MNPVLAFNLKKRYATTVKSDSLSCGALGALEESSACRSFRTG
jgi:hypothetical protein